VVVCDAQIVESSSATDFSTWEITRTAANAASSFPFFGILTS